MSVYQLILFPHRDDVTAGQRARLLTRLQETGFVGAPFTLDGREHFTTGAQFLDQLTFLGCSPFIETEPPADPGERAAAARRGGFCHIHLTPALPQPRFRANARARVRCPACRQSLAAAELPADPQALHGCGRCGHRAAVADWNWQGHAGYANLFLEIWGIHPGEAAPTEVLLQVLENTTDSEWSSFYTEADTA